MGFPDRPQGQEEPAPLGGPGPYEPAAAPGYQQAPGYQAPGGYQAPDYQRAPGRANGMAIAALVCGLAQFVLWFFILVPGFIAALLALTFGLVGLAQIKRRGERGKGMAIAGIVLGVLGVISGIIWVILIAAGTTHINYHMGNY